MQTSLLGSSSTTTTTSTSVTGNAASAASDMFTKLLVAQIQNQDPLSPTDPSEFVQQLTQLSQTESLQNLATLTSANASVLQSMQVLAMGGQVGSDVLATTTSVTLDGSTAVSGEITFANANSSSTLVLTDSSGTKHTIALGSTAVGEVAFSIDPAKLGLAAGSYSLSVDNTSKETPSIAVEGRLNSVRLSTSGSVVLNISNLGEVAPSAITAFNGTSTATSL